MKSLTQLALSILFALALGEIAEAQVTLNGPLRVTDALNGGKAIDIPAGKSVVVKDFTQSANPTAAVFFNISQNKAQRGSDGDDYFPGNFNGKNVFISRDAMIQGLSNTAPTKAPASADPKATVERLATMNKSTGKGPNGTPPCESCGHLAGIETEEFDKITKSDEELRKYTCLFHKHTNATGVGDRNFEMTLPMMKEVAKATGVPAVYTSCIIQQESQYEIFNGGGHTGLGHFGSSTAGSIAQDTLEAVKEIAAKKGFPNRTASQVKAMILMNDGTRLTEEIALYQTAAIAMNAKRLLNEFAAPHMNFQSSAVKHDGRALINTLLLAAAGHNVGQGVITTIPPQAFTSNTTDWTRRVGSGVTRVYLENMKMCMEKGNFNARDNGVWKPDHARCGG